MFYVAHCCKLSTNAILFYDYNFDIFILSQSQWSFFFSVDGKSSFTVLKYPYANMYLLMLQRWVFPHSLARLILDQY